MRYPAAPGLESRRGGAGEGVWAPPGKYRVSAAFDGAHVILPLEVLPDPRLQLPPAAYAEQFTLAREIEAERAKLAPAIRDAEAMIPKLEGERRRQAIEITGIDPATANAWWLFPKSTATLRFAADKLAALQQAVDGADAAPTPDAREGFAKAKAIGEEALAKWERFKREGGAKP
jgi:hypothetical protein